MALGTPTYLAGATGTTSAVTSSITPTNGALILARVAGRLTGAIPAAPTISDTLGLTWTLVLDFSNDFNSAPDMYQRVFSAIGTGQATTITGACSDGTTTIIDVVEVTGASETITNTGTGVNGAGDPSATLASAPDTTVLGLALGGGATTWNTPAGFTRIGGVTSGNFRTDVAYDDTAPTAGPHQWTSTFANSMAVLLELEEAGSGAQSITGALYADADTFGTATVGRGAVNITGAVYTDADSFGSAIVSQGGATQGITGARFADADTFGAAAVSATYGITAAHVANANSFGSASVTQPATQEIAGAHFANASSFGRATVATARQRRGGDDAPPVPRKVRRRITRDELYRIMRVEPEAETAPPPTPKRRKAIVRKVVDTVEAGGLLAVREFVQREVAQAYRPNMALAELQMAVQRIAEEARRMEQELEDEDEMILLLAA